MPNVCSLSTILTTPFSSSSSKGQDTSGTISILAFIYNIFDNSRLKSRISRELCFSIYTKSLFEHFGGSLLGEKRDPEIEGKEGDEEVEDKGIECFDMQGVVAGIIKSIDFGVDAGGDVDCSTQK